MAPEQVLNFFFEKLNVLLGAIHLLAMYTKKFVLLEHVVREILSQISIEHCQYRAVKMAKTSDSSYLPMDF